MCVPPLVCVALLLSQLLQIVGKFSRLFFLLLLLLSEYSLHVFCTKNIADKRGQKREEGGGKEEKIRGSNQMYFISIQYGLNFGHKFILFFFFC